MLTVRADVPVLYQEFVDTAPDAKRVRLWSLTFRMWHPVLTRLESLQVLPFPVNSARCMTPAVARLPGT
ncbi:hypothetical protein CCR75_002068 [Bremia lactucae]|uniref:Uncharacterized protein n=1 Tax=Bremia lactucae TaxID=4779 RepID=A0A976IKI3_BRELC|nr:hypothetical protein CCR75_002068 [Bremia lactucae]